MIRFKELEIQGFGSIIKTLTYQLNNKGLNCIIGKNGSGKTSIFSALCWVLYGTTLKGKAEPWKKIKPTKWQGTKVSVTFIKNKKEYKVINCQDYKGEIGPIRLLGASKMFLFVDGKYISNLRDKNDVKAEVQKILGMSFNLFKNTILFGQKLKRIIQESGPDKKEIFEEAFEASFINEARAVADLKLKEYKDREKDLLFKLESLENNKANLEELIKSDNAQKSNRENQIKELEAERDKIGLEPQFKTLGTEDRLIALIKITRGNLKEQGFYKNKAFRVGLSKGKYETEVRLSKTSLSDILTELQKIPKNCRLCGSALDKEKILKTKKSIKARYNKKKAEIEKAKDKVIILQKRVDKINTKLARFELIEKKLNNLTKRLQLVQTYQIYQKQINSLINNSRPENKDRKTLNKKLEEIEAKIKVENLNLSKVKVNIDTYTWLVQKPLSNSGIKAYIFNELLNEVNQRLNYYTSYIGFRVEFGIDLESARKDFYTVCFRGDAVVDYKELSGGQQQLVDIAIAFSIHDVVNENHKMNILIMDEVFESLDESNIEVVSDLIAHKAKDKSVHVISHRSEFSTARGKVLRLKLDEDGRTIA